MDLKTIKGGAIVFGLVLFAVIVGLAIYNRIVKKKDEIEVTSIPSAISNETVTSTLTNTTV